jgi:hypothetical protein
MEWIGCHHRVCDYPRQKRKWAGRSAGYMYLLRINYLDLLFSQPVKLHQDPDPSNGSGDTTAVPKRFIRYGQQASIQPVRLLSIGSYLSFFSQASKILNSFSYQIYKMIYG